MLRLYRPPGTAELMLQFALNVRLLGYASNKSATSGSHPFYKQSLSSFLRSWAVGVLAFNAAIWPQLSSNAQELVQISEPATPLELLEARFKETELRLRSLEASIQNQSAPSQALFPVDASNPTDAQGLQFYTSRQTDPSFDPQDGSPVGKKESSTD